MSKYYAEDYDVIVIGAALSGLAATLTLLSKNKKVLVLEQHNLPGGVATSFVRGGVEIEASLHEMMSIGDERYPLKIRKFLEENDVFVDWMRVPIAYRFVSPTVNQVIHAGIDGTFDIPAKDIANACNDTDGTIYNKLMELFKVCLNVYNAVNIVSVTPMSKIQMLKKFPDLVRTAGYSTKEVFDKFALPKDAIDILSAYWIYVGSPISELPFTIYAFLLADYMGYGSYIPRGTSHEMSLKMAEKCMEKGAQVEFGVRVDKILVKDGKVCGVRTANGDEIKADYVISGAYPNKVYSQMIEPSTEVSQNAIKFVNSKDLGVTSFSVVLLLDKSPEELNMHDYATFYSVNDFDLDKIWEEGKNCGGWTYITSICSNIAHPDITPKGTTLYSITYLPKSDAFKDINPENYDDVKHKIALEFIEMESKRLGVDLKKHIKEIVIETPVTISHYTGAWQGSIYGYRHTMDDHIIARLGMSHDEHYISGLAFAGAHQISGDGMGPAITNGRKGAKDILDEMKRREQNEGK